jgi:hypothetical protein
MDTPQGFAHFDKEKKVLKYISSEGVRVKVSAVKNEPYGDASMWQSALDVYLQAKGYHRTERNDIGTPENMKGIYSEYRYVFNAETYTYAMALFADKEYLYLVESGGPKKYFDVHRPKIVAAIRTLKVK